MGPGPALQLRRAGVHGGSQELSRPSAGATRPRPAPTRTQRTMMLGRLAAHLTPSTADDMFTASATAATAPPTRPHILLAVADDLGWNDVGSFNPGPRTPSAPTLDGLMAQGVKLKQHYSVSPPQHSRPPQKRDQPDPLRTGGHLLAHPRRAHVRPLPAPLGRPVRRRDPEHRELLPNG